MGVRSGRAFNGLNWAVAAALAPKVPPVTQAPLETAPTPPPGHGHNNNVYRPAD